MPDKSDVTIVILTCEIDLLTPTNYNLVTHDTHVDPLGVVLNLPALLTPNALITSEAVLVFLCSLFAREMNTRLGYILIQIART